VTDWPEPLNLPFPDTIAAPSPEEFVARGYPRPGQPGWSQLTDANIVVAGLSVVARRHIVRHLLYAIDEEATRQPAKRDEADFLLGAWRSTQAIQALLKSGWTWERSRRRPRKRCIMDLMEDVTWPPRIPKRSVPDSLWFTRRRALQALLDFHLDVPAKRVMSIPDQTLNAGAYRRTRSPVAVHPTDLHRRVAAVIRFYGAGRPVVHQGGPRAWRLCPWRLWRIDGYLDLYRDVRLDSLDWLPATHFLGYLEASHQHWRKRLLTGQQAGGKELLPERRTAPDPATMQPPKDGTRLAA
jgi:hypothetical protein